MILAEESGKLLVRCDNCEKEWWITESSNTAKNKGDEHHCSRECRLANKKNGISPCAWCGTPVKQYLSAIKRGRTPFCSTECSKAHHAANNTTEVTCSVCGKPFTITNARLKNEQKTLCCSMSCSNKVRKTGKRSGLSALFAERDLHLTARTLARSAAQEPVLPSTKRVSTQGTKVICGGEGLLETLFFGPPRSTGSG